MANYFNPRHDFNVRWTISDLQFIFNECKSETKLVQKEFNDTITPMVKKVAAVLQKYMMLFTVTVKNSKIPIDPNEELKLKCTQRISGKQDAAFELLENEILCVKSNKVSQLIASIHSKKGYLCWKWNMDCVKSKAIRNEIRFTEYDSKPSVKREKKEGIFL